MTRRVLALLVVLVGLTLIATALVEDLFTVGSSFEELSDDFRPIMTEEALAVLASDVAALSAVSEEFGSALAPAIAAQLDMTPEQLNEFMGANFPAVAQGVQALPEVGPEFAGIVAILQSQLDNFAGADAIPTKDITAFSVPVGIVAVGVLLIAIGAVMFFRKDRLGPWLAVGLGVVVIAGSFIVDLLNKTNEADALNNALKPVYTEELVAGAEQGLAVVGAMGQQMQAEMLPALAGQLGMTPEQMGAFIGDNFPAVGAALQSLPDALGRFTNVVTVFDDNLGNYENLKPVDLSNVLWILIVSAAVAAVIGAVALVLGGTPESETEEEAAAAT